MIKRIGKTIVNMSMFIKFMAESILIYLDWRIFRPHRYAPGPRGLAAWKAMIASIRAFMDAEYVSTSGFYDQMLERYGQIVMIPLPFWQFIVLVYDSDAHGYVSSHHRQFPRSILQQSFKAAVGEIVGGEGEEQRRLRKLINPALDRKAIFQHVEKIQRIVQEELREIQCFPQGGLVNFQEWLTSLYARLTAEILTNGAKVPREFGLMAVQLVELFPKSFGRSKEYKALKAKLDAIVLDLFEECKKGADYGTLSVLYTEYYEGRLTLDQAIAEVLGYFNAATETTANTVSWMLYFLSQNEAEYAKLREEALRVFGDSEVITAEQVKELTYSLRAFKEAARLRPQVWRQLRQANGTQILTVLGTEYIIPRAAQVFDMVFHIQTDPPIWGNDALEFDPENMRPEYLEPLLAVYKYAYIPWATSIHMCPGMPLAQLEGPLVASMIARQFSRVELPSGQKTVFGPVIGFPHNVVARFVR